MGHQRSFVLNFFPLKVQVLEKFFLEKVVPLVKTNTKLL